MIKLVAISILSLVINFQIMTNIQLDTKDELCFSKTNFDNVYRYILMKTQNDKTKTYVYDGFEIVLEDHSKIFFKQNGYTFSIVDKERGIYSLLKIFSDNIKHIQKANELFCELALLAKN